MAKKKQTTTKTQRSTSFSLPPILAERMSPIERAQAQLEALKISGAKNLESAAMSAVTAAKGIDRIAESQMGMTGKAMPSGEPNVTLPPTTTTPTGGATPGAPNVGTVAAGSSNKVSAFDKLKQRLTARNLGSLYDSVVGLIQADLPEEEFTFQLRETPAYKQRFKANATRIANGLTPIGEAAYLDLEDQFQGVMRKRGLPESYWKRSGLGEQEGFDSLIAGDVSADELDSRINAAQMVINANPQVMQSFKSYYPEIKNGDILGYVLNPKAGLIDIERKVRGAQIGGAALTAGLAGPSATRLNELIAAGTSETEAQRGFQSIANILPETKKLSEIYDSGGYTQAEAEAEAFGLAGGIESGRKRRRLASQERASFAGQVGISGTALERGRSGAF